MEMETEEDGGGVGVERDGLTDDGADDWLGDGAYSGVEADSKHLSFRNTKDESEN